MIAKHQHSKQSRDQRRFKRGFKGGEGGSLKSLSSRSELCKVGSGYSVNDLLKDGSRTVAIVTYIAAMDGKQRQAHRALLRLVYEGNDTVAKKTKTKLLL